MKNEITYTEEELKILDYVENQNPKSVPNVAAEKERYKQIFTDNVNKRKQISLRLLEADVQKIKTRAISDGLPYQTLISSVIHQYVTGKLVTRD